MSSCIQIYFRYEKSKIYGILVWLLVCSLCFKNCICAEEVEVINLLYGSLHNYDGLWSLNI